MRHIARRSSCSSYFVQRQGFQCHGTKLPEAISSRFELLHRSFQLGISQRRAEWLTRWTREVSNSDFVNMTAFEQGLGGVMYVVSALEYERLFLAPLYSSCASIPEVQSGESQVMFLLVVMSFPIDCSRSSLLMRRRIATVILFTTKRRSSEFGLGRESMVGSHTSTRTGLLTYPARLRFHMRSKLRDWGIWKRQQAVAHRDPRGSRSSFIT